MLVDWYFFRVIEKGSGTELLPTYDLIPSRYFGPWMDY